MNRITSFVRSNPLALAAMAFAVTGSAMAEPIDTTEVVATITGGLAAIAAIGAAFLGFKYLKKVWNRL